MQPEPLRPVREIMRRMRSTNQIVDPSDKQPGMEYCRMFNGNNGYEITEARLLGWKVVTGDDPEDIDNKAPDGTRVLGDTVLLKISAERRKEITDYKNEIDQRLSGREDEALDESIKQRGTKYVKPVTFNNREEFADAIKNGPKGR